MPYGLFASAPSTRGGPDVDSAAGDRLLLDQFASVRRFADEAIPSFADRPVLPS